jgi:hypothetical protein
MHKQERERGEERGRGERRYAKTSPLSPPPLPLYISPPTLTPAHERRNFWILIIYQIVLRAG